MALYQNFTSNTLGTIIIPGPIIGTHTTNTIANIFTFGGNVGINMTNPSFTLDVNGTINTPTFTGGNISISGSIQTKTNIEAIGNLTNGGYDFILGNANQVARGNSGASRALVKDGVASLKINYAGDFTGGTEVQGTSLSHSGFFSATGNSNTLGNLVTTGGNIGIGTVNPTQIMHIQRSGSDNYLKIDAGGAASNVSGIMLSEHNLNYGWSLRHDAGTDLLYISYQDNTPSFTNTTIFNRSGQIGINKTPAYTLDINGNRLNLHNANGTNGGQNLFEGIISENQRAQIVISGMYSDMVIASSQANDFHGSTLTLATYNPSNKADYRKWVINQGNWGSRSQMLEFGYRSTVSNPHEAIADAYVAMTLDGTNQRVGIGNRNPTYKLDISQSTNGGDAYGLRVSTSTSTSGSARTYGLWVDASGSDDANYAAIFNTGNVGIGTAAPNVALDVRGSGYFGNFTGFNSGATALLTFVTGGKLCVSSGVNGLPATTGTNGNAIAFRIRGGDNASLDFGANSINTWLQATDFSSGYTNNYHIHLNPNGGNVAIGNGGSTPTYKFEVNGVIKNTSDIIMSSASRLTLYNDTGPLQIRSHSTNMLHLNQDNTGNISLGVGGGSVGVGTVSPGARLHVFESSGTVAGVNSGSIILDHDNSGGASSITFRSKVNRSSDYAYIQYQDSATVGGAGETARFIIGIQNDADDHIILDPSGSVGIGTYSPGFKLHVNGNMRADEIYNGGWFRNYGDTGLYNQDYACHFLRNDAQYGNWRIYGNAVNNWNGLRFTQAEISLMAGDGATKTCGFHYNGTGWALQVDSGRNLYIPGDITAYWSDRRLKTNLRQLSHFDHVLSSLTGYTFNWNEKGQQIINKPADYEEVGLIAQDVQAVIPQAVKVNKAGVSIDDTPDSFDYLTINYDKIVPFLIEGYKAQRQEITDLKCKLDRLEELVQQLLTR